MFSHEKFGAYQAAIDFVALAADISNEIPKGNSELIDQLKRASTSIALNIAEGTGRATKTEMKRFYIIARGSALECVAILNVFQKFGLISSDLENKGRSLLRTVVSILTPICRR